MIHPTAIIGEAPESRDYWHDETQSTFPPFIHPTARVHAFVTVDAGMRCQTKVGAQTWLGKHVHIGHDAQIGKNCELAPGVVICGHVEIGDGVKIGVNACVRPFVKIGPLARIGCGAVVISDVPGGHTYAGNPARQIVKKGAYLPPDDDRTALEEIWELALERAREVVADEARR